MKCIEIRDRFGLENLAFASRPTPVVGPNRVLIRMRSAALNYRDLLTVRGEYNPKQPLPLIPGSDGVGEVVEVGEHVTRVKVGDRVLPIFAQKWISGEPNRERLHSTLGGPLDGTLSEFVELDGDGVVPAPIHLSNAEAATLPCAGVTAWSALVTHGALKAGDTVLVQGTGGVSIFALQLARLLGARVIVTSSSDEKLEKASGLGAWGTINYRSTPDWGNAAKRLTEGRGVDVVIEVGGANTLEQSLAAVRFGGCIALIGVLSGVRSKLNIVPIPMRQIRVQGILVGNREQFEALNRAINEHEMRPVVDREFPLVETRDALTYMAQGRHFGKICIQL